MPIANSWTWHAAVSWQWLDRRYGFKILLIIMCKDRSSRDIPRIPSVGRNALLCPKLHPLGCEMLDIVLDPLPSGNLMVPPHKCYWSIGCRHLVGFQRSNMHAGGTRCSLVLRAMAILCRPSFVARFDGRLHTVPWLILCFMTVCPSSFSNPNSSHCFAESNSKQHDMSFICYP